MPTQIRAGELLDRLGREKDGRFLSPLGTPFPERALPPSSLNDMPGVPNGYHAYEIVRNFDADVGYIAPAFGQPGGGLQILVEEALLGSPGPVDVQWLLDNGYLRDLTGALL